MCLSSNIKILRKRMKRTQDEVACALHLRRSTYSGYENDIAQPGIDTLISLSEYFSVSIDSLVKRDLSKLGELELRQIERGYDECLNKNN